jgi:hypothetical protein
MGDHFYSANEYLRERFGSKVYRLSLDGGMTCPNRDGTLGTGGCIFCLEGSSHFSESIRNDISSQIENARKRVEGKAGRNARYMAYFQSYTNTYAPVSRLRSLFIPVAERDDILAISIATRPDCLPDGVLELLNELSQIKPVFVELGLQTSNEHTAGYIRRCYKNDVYLKAVRDLKSIGINVITHMILGLPGEDRENMVDTARFISDAGSDGIKFQLLHVLRGTDLAEEYEKGLFRTMSLEGYASALEDCIRAIRPGMVVHRITGDGPKKYLIAPLWSADKKSVLNYLNRRFEEDALKQGSACAKNSWSNASRGL